MAGRASAQAALETRNSVLRAAADLASVEGLDSVTIGRLASMLDMSKSGVIGQFGSKERLQLDTIEMVFDVFRSQVFETVRGVERGLPRLLATCRSWMDYAADPGFPGGCFVTQVTFDYDGRPGVVHDRIAEGRNAWRDFLRHDAQIAIDAGDLPAGTDADQIVFALESLAAGITSARMLHGDRDAARWALRSMYAVLGVDPPRT